MRLSKTECNGYKGILEDNLLPAMGCTEPIAVAYAAAKCADVLGEEPLHIDVYCSGNIIKNVKGVTVPNSGGHKGIETAAVLGAVGGDPGKELEVISGVNDEEREKTAELVAQGICSVYLTEDVPNLYIRIEMAGKSHSAKVILKNSHTGIALIEKDGKIVFEEEQAEENPFEPAKEEFHMSLQGILSYADTVELSTVRKLIEKQIEYNKAVSAEGLNSSWGTSVGTTIMKNWGDDVRSRACAYAAAGSDARMGGCALPVIINSGSGNQGITVTMPVIVYAEEWKVSEEKLYRSLIVSNLVSIYIKQYIGPLSAFCGAVSASCGAGAAITYMAGGDYDAIGRTITNTLGNVGGIVCDGAKPSCAAKIASSVNAALLAHYMSMDEKCFRAGEGFVEADIEDTIRNMGYIGKVGMKDTDVEILRVMIDSAAVVGEKA